MIPRRDEPRTDDGGQQELRSIERSDDPDFNGNDDGVAPRRKPNIKRERSPGIPMSKRAYFVVILLFFLLAAAFQRGRNTFVREFVTVFLPVPPANKYQLQLQLRIIQPLGNFHHRLRPISTEKHDCPEGRLLDFLTLPSDAALHQPLNLNYSGSSHL
jgi:hypothetical protein